jgi:uncharacterized protein YhbP (UPF0306 family)
MTTEEAIRKRLPQGRLMQLATVSGGKPWISTVYFVADDALNLYWLSFPTRRHSQEIAEFPFVAVAIAVKSDQPVVGIQAEGRAGMVEDAGVVQDVMLSYVKKYGTGKKFYDALKAGRAQHRLYRLTPENYVLFDEADFPPEEGRQEWRPPKPTGVR